MPESTNSNSIARRLTFIYVIWWAQWIGMQVYVVHRIGFNLVTSISDSLLNNILLIAASYGLNNVLRYYQLQKKQRYVGLLWNIGFAAICISIFNWLQSNLFIVDKDYIAFLHKATPVRFCFALLMVTCASMVSWVWYQLVEQQEIQKRKSDLEKLVKESELIKIRQQLQPHFLFNSLNSISALIGSKPEEARKMIQQLSDFLRGTLRKDDQQLVNLAEELQHLQLYLDIEKVRFGHRLNVNIDCNEESKKLMLPSLLLQPIVENAIKFGLYDTTGETTISIKSEMHAGHLIINIQNPYDPETARPKLGTGFGLTSVERRLYLLYGRNDLLVTKSDGHIFTTFVKIPQSV